MTRRGRVSARARVVALVAAVAVGAILGVGRLALPGVPRWFIQSDTLAPCDLIVVCGSDSDGSAEAVGVRLWRQGFGRSLLCVGGSAAWHVTEDEVMARHARTLGMPKERVLRFHIPFSNEPDAGTMREEVRRLLPFLQAQGAQSVLLISGDLESRRRALLVRPWRRAGLRVLIYPIANSGFRPTGWWRRKVDTKAVVGEALGWLTLPFGS